MLLNKVGKNIIPICVRQNFIELLIPIRLTWNSTLVSDVIETKIFMILCYNILVL